MLSVAYGVEIKKADKLVQNYKNKDVTGIYTVPWVGSGKEEVVVNGKEGGKGWGGVTGSHYFFDQLQGIIEFKLIKSD